MNKEETIKTINTTLNFASKIKEIKDAHNNFRKGSKQNFNFFYGIVRDKAHIEKYHSNFIAYL